MLNMRKLILSEILVMLRIMELIPDVITRRISVCPTLANMVESAKKPGGRICANVKKVTEERIVLKVIIYFRILRFNMLSERRMLYTTIGVNVEKPNFVKI